MFLLRTNYEKDRIAHAKRIMKPFFLRRLKSDVSFTHCLSISDHNLFQVLTDLPNKITSVERVPMSQRQSELYYKLVSDYKDRAVKVSTVMDTSYIYSS